MEHKCLFNFPLSNVPLFGSFPPNDCTFEMTLCSLLSSSLLTFILFCLFCFYFFSTNGYISVFSSYCYPVVSCFFCLAFVFRAQLSYFCIVCMVIDSLCGLNGAHSFLFFVVVVVCVCVCVCVCVYIYLLFPVSGP